MLRGRPGEGNSDLGHEISFPGSGAAGNERVIRVTGRLMRKVCPDLSLCGEPIFAPKISSEI